jgi:RNA polymerase sporulation-specific sigma factor
MERVCIEGRCRLQVITYECNSELIDRFRAGDSKALDELVRLNLPLVLSVSKLYFNRGIEKDDIIQTGCLGLVKAAMNYNKDYNTQFSTYASYLIKGEIRRHIRDDWPFKVSRTTKAKAREIYKAKQKLSNELMRDPSAEELAQCVGMEIDEMDRVMDSTRRPQYLCGVIYEDGGAPITALDKLSLDTTDEIDMVDLISLKIARELLDENQRKVIQLRYFEDMTQSMVAKIIGVSQVQVSRIEMKAKKILKNKLS